MFSKKKKSTNRANHKIGTSQQISWKILRRRLQFKPYRVQLLQYLTPEDNVSQLKYCFKMLEALQDDDFTDMLIFSDEATFHLTGKVNRHNVRF